MWLLALCIIVFLEVLWSLITFPCRRKERPLTVSNGILSLSNKPFQPVFWGIGGYTQTCLNRTLSFFQKRPYTRFYCTLTDQTQVALDIKETRTMPLNTPILFICHGLGGCSDNPFIHLLADTLPQYRSIVYNRRGHADTFINGKYPTHVDMTDMDEVLACVKQKYPKAPLYGIGISAGANLLVCYAGQTVMHPFKALVSISNGHCVNSVVNNVGYVMDNFLVSSLRDIFTHNQKELKYYCKVNNIHLDWDKIQQCRTTKEFEKELMVPLYGYKDLTDYYNKCSSYKWFNNIQVPLFSLSSLDDPVIVEEATHYYPMQAAINNHHITAMLTKRGGHVAWVDAWGHSWAVEQVAEFIRGLG